MGSSVAIAHYLAHRCSHPDLWDYLPSHHCACACACLALLLPRVFCLQFSAYYAFSLVQTWLAVLPHACGFAQQRQRLRAVPARTDIPALAPCSGHLWSLLENCVPALDSFGSLMEHGCAWLCLLTFCQRPPSQWRNLLCLPMLPYLPNPSLYACA